MFRSLQVEHFRGFKKVELDNLERFNLIMGKNNAGKTAILEALFMLAGPNNPDLALRINIFRGFEQFKNDPEDLWGWVFHKKDMQSQIVIEGRTGATSSKKLTIRLDESLEVKLGKTNKNRKSPLTSSSTELAPGRLVWTYHDEKHQKTISQASVKDASISIDRGRSLKLPTSIYVSSRAGYVSENAQRFSTMEETGDEKQLLPPLQLLEPRLTKLAVLVTGNGPTIHGEIGIGRMVPIQMMGDGVGRLLTLLLSVYSSKGGAVFIDEFETGLHYSVMETMWKAISIAAREANVQLFATTHSWECITAGHSAFMSTKQSDIAIYRLERIDGEVNAVRFNNEMLQAAIETGVEVR